MSLRDDAHKCSALRKGRLVAIVLVAVAVLWIAAQFVIDTIGISQRYALLIDLFALAGFIWCFVNIWQIWKLTRES